MSEQLFSTQTGSTTCRLLIAEFDIYRLQPDLLGTIFTSHLDCQILGESGCVRFSDCVHCLSETAAGWQSSALCRSYRNSTTGIRINRECGFIWFISRPISCNIQADYNIRCNCLSIEYSGNYGYAFCPFCRNQIIGIVIFIITQ